MANDEYQRRIEAEKAHYSECLDVHALPEIFHYWAHTHLRPLLEDVGITSMDGFFAEYLHESSSRSPLYGAPAFLSIGSGNCDTEVRLAKLLRERGLQEFTIECLELNPHMLERGREFAKSEGVGAHLRFTEGDFNDWHASRLYAGVMANQSLHHVTELERLFDEIKLVLAPGCYFVTSDVIGRNGHQRWPEALTEVHRFWNELPEKYRYNRLLQRQEELYENWDCSSVGFEGIRAQDVLPLLMARFEFYVYAAFGNVIDIFIDRCFGHHFKPDLEWDRGLIDRIHETDDRGFREGTLKPTHLIAVMTSGEPPARRYARGLTPAASLRPTQGS